MIYTTKKNVGSLDDLSGLKMRIGGGIVSEIAQRLGMIGVQAPSPQVYEILANGVADGILFPAESVPFFRIDEVIRHGVSVPGGLYNTSFFVVMNRDVWNRLSDEDKAAIDSVSGEAMARMAGKAWDAADAAGTETMLEKGVTLSKADDAMTAAITEKLDGINAGFMEAAKAAGHRRPGRDGHAQGRGRRGQMSTPAKGTAPTPRRVTAPGHPASRAGRDWACPSSPPCCSW